MRDALMEASYAISLMLPLWLLLSLFLTKPKTHSGGYDSRWYGDVLVLTGPKPAPNSKSSCNSKYQWSALFCLPKQPHWGWAPAIWRNQLKPENISILPKFSPGSFYTSLAFLPVSTLFDFSSCAKWENEFWSGLLNSAQHRQSYTFSSSCIIVCRM